MSRFSFSMNARLTTNTYLASPGTSALQKLYSSHENQNKAFYQILGNNQLNKRIYKYNKYGTNINHKCS